MSVITDQLVMDWANNSQLTIYTLKFPYRRLLENTVSKPAVPTRPAARPIPNHKPNGKATERNAKNCRETGVAFCTDRIEIATTKNAGITTSRNLTIRLLDNRATLQSNTNAILTGLAST